MSDIAILKEMIQEKKDAIVALNERREKTHLKYSVLLTELQDSYSVTIDGMPKPDEVIIIHVDKFKLAGEFCNGSKGECKRADFVIITDTATEKIILCIEMKKRKDSNKTIIQQLKGAKCFVYYCQEIGKEFWNQYNFLKDYQYRFVSICHIPISKTKTRSDLKTINPNETHNSPERMLKISGKNHIQFNSLL